jgi:hypothetical protein
MNRKKKLTNNELKKATGGYWNVRPVVDTQGNAVVNSSGNQQKVGWWTVNASDAGTAVLDNGTISSGGRKFDTNGNEIHQKFGE